MKRLVKCTKCGAQTVVNSKQAVEDFTAKHWHGDRVLAWQHIESEELGRVAK